MKKRPYESEKEGLKRGERQHHCAVPLWRCGSDRRSRARSRFEAEIAYLHGGPREVRRAFAGAACDAYYGFPLHFERNVFALCREVGRKEEGGGRGKDEWEEYLRRMPRSRIRTLRLPFAYSGL